MLPGPQGVRGCHPILNASPYCPRNPTKFEIRTLGGASGNMVSAGGEWLEGGGRGGAIFAVGTGRKRLVRSPLGRNICGRCGKEKASAAPFEPQYLRSARREMLRYKLVSDLILSIISISKTRQFSKSQNKQISQTTSISQSTTISQNSKYLKQISQNKQISQANISKTKYLNLPVQYLNLPRVSQYLKKAISQLALPISQLASGFAISQKANISTCLVNISNEMKTCLWSNHEQPWK